MTVERQTTIARPVRARGISVHGGREVEAVLHPAQPDSGIIFRCRRGQEEIDIPARSEAIVEARSATSLASGSTRISTVEHLLAALSASGLDNALVATGAEELPVLDGSAQGWVELLKQAGRHSVSQPRRFFEVRRTLEIVRDTRRIRISPAPRFSLYCEIVFEHPAIGRQVLEIDDLTPIAFERELASARTFGFEADVEALHAVGLARGASFENTVVLGEKEVLNPEGLRWPDEFVRHKALDLVGDMALLGGGLLGRVEVERGGHALHHALLNALRSDPESGRWVEVPDS